jgi:hypothetical protein
MTTEIFTYERMNFTNIRGLYIGKYPLPRGGRISANVILGKNIKSGREKGGKYKRTRKKGERNWKKGKENGRKGKKKRKGKINAK